MQLDSLTVLQVQKKNALAPQFDLVESFYVESCLRKLWVTNENYFSLTALELPPQVEVFRGIEAYHLLLKISCGLKSELIGETDIFGQLKSAWAQYLDSHTALSKELCPWFNRLFEDAKDIRTGFLQGLGGAQSYGGAVKKLLAFRPGDSVLLVGAGALAQSIAPFLHETDLHIWNRTPEKATELSQLIKTHHPLSSPKLIHSSQELALAWAFVKTVIIAVPGEGIKLPAFEQTSPGTLILHLGLLRQNVASGTPVLTLDDVFEIQKQQSQNQLDQINLAKKACWERAQLRDLGQGSVTMPHSWEDLALFE
jgi:glutamyl-tRNA reductase